MTNGGMRGGKEERRTGDEDRGKQLEYLGVRSMKNTERDGSKEEERKGSGDDGFRTHIHDLMKKGGGEEARRPRI